MKTALIITAGGIGSRFGGAEGKQLLRIKNKPLLIYTCERFQHLTNLTEVFVTIEPSRIEIFQGLLKEYRIKLPIRVIAGGETRRLSVEKAFAALSSETERVMIHDGARPNVASDLIVRLLDASLSYTAVIPVIPVVDTIKVVNDNMVLGTPDRNTLFCVQTPQVFSYKLLKKAYAIFSGADVTDEASLIEKMGEAVYVVPGERANIKLTYPEDILYLREL